MKKLFRQLRDQQDRLELLDNYRRGRPPLVLGSQRLQSAFYQFQNMARTNFAELIVTARTDRMSVRSIRTAAANDDNGDQQAWRLWTGNCLDIGSTDVFDSMCTFGRAYVAIAAPDDANGLPVITVEDPRQVITAQDPVNPQKTLAAFKIFHDDMHGMDYAYLWLPGQMWVACRPRSVPPPKPVGARWGHLDGPPPPTPVAFNPATFTMLPMGQRNLDGVIEFDAVQDENTLPLDEGYDGPTSEQYALQLVPVVPFGNRKGIGVFELHTDLLDRINHNILNRIVIATLQAFKQRAIELDPAAGEDGGLPDEDEDGNPINYDDIFEADPGALWRLPLGAKIWESGQVDLSGITTSSNADILQLSTVTKTPFPTFSPDSANQSANGAQLYREGLSFSVEDLCKIAGRGFALVVAIGFQMVGDKQRGQVADVIVDWAPAERYSIIEMAQADSLSRLPMAQKFSRIYGMSPADVKIALAQASQEAFMNAIAAGTPGTPGTPAGGATGAQISHPAPLADNASEAANAG